MSRQGELDHRAPTTQEAELERELDRRLTVLETVESADPVHAKLSGASLALFLGVAGVIAVASWIGGAL